jgi:hypothetical protein
MNVLMFARKRFLNENTNQHRQNLTYNGLYNAGKSLWLFLNGVIVTAMCKFHSLSQKVFTIIQLLLIPPPWLSYTYNWNATILAKAH